MKKIAILSSHYGKVFRGSEFWIESLKQQLKENFQITVFSDLKSYKDWLNYDIIIPIDGRFQVFICRILTWLKNKPMIVFGHSGPGADDKWNLYCSPNIFVAFSNYQKKWAEKYKLPWTKVVYISHAIDLNKFKPAIKKPNKKIVLCVAANTPNKRVRLVEKAVKYIPGATFMAVGKGNQIEASFDEMPAIYKKADVFCFVPQPFEAFGLVFLEALASNLPIITNNDPIRKEIVGDAGILVNNPENIRDLSDSISYALETNWEDKPRNQAENFSWEKIKMEYIDLFNNIK